MSWLLTITFLWSIFGDGGSCGWSKMLTCCGARCYSSGWSMFRLLWVEQDSTLVSGVVWSNGRVYLVGWTVSWSNGHSCCGARFYFLIESGRMDTSMSGRMDGLARSCIALFRTWSVPYLVACNLTRF